MRTLLLGFLFAVQLSTLKIDVKLAQVTATILDKQGRYVSDLKLDDFILEENGQIQKIAHFSRNPEAPLSIGILIDTSASMMRTLPIAIGAARTFVRSLRASDEVQVMYFDNQFAVAQRFTVDGRRAELALQWLRVEGGGTYLLDAIAKALVEMQSARYAKRVVIVVTDGGENWNGIGLDVLRSDLHASNVLIYPIAILPETDTPTGPRLLMRFLAVASGGRDTVIRDEPTSEGKRRETLERMLAEIQTELRDQYTLGYYPTGNLKPQDRSITVRVKRPGVTLRIRDSL